MHGDIKVKPFNKVIHNAQCARCGEWGHKSVDRECSLKDFNPNDFSRLKREDPMDKYIDDVCLQNNDNNSEDYEIEKFLLSLTKREKKLLVKKLKTLILNARAS